MTGLPTFVPAAHPLIPPLDGSKKTELYVAPATELGAIEKLPAELDECIIVPKDPTAQLFESLTMYTEFNTQAQGLPTVFPVHVLPSYQSVEGAAVVPPTAQPLDPPERYTP
jgi:hypothetical protein